MRVSSTMMSNNYLKQLNGTYEQYTKLMEQSDGSKLHRASDDAVGYSKYLRYQNSLANNEQFTTNTKTAVSWMDNTDSALINVTDLMSTFKEKTVAAGNSTNNESDMQDIAKELLANVQEVISDMNTQIGDRYLFSGQKDTTMPFEISDEKKARGETKTLSDAQAEFFDNGDPDYTNAISTGSVNQMLKLTDDENNVYYLNTKTRKYYTEDFVENGYKDVDTSDPDYLKDREAGTISSFTTSTYFKSNGTLVDPTNNTVTAVKTDGSNTTLTFSTVNQYIVTYNGDDKDISMVKRTGGTDPNTDSVNVTGQDTFGSDIFDCGESTASGAALLNDLLYAVAKIDAADNDWAGNDGLTIADTAHSQVLGAETTLAARNQAYTAAQDMLTTQNESITADITDVSSTDVAVLATKLMEYQTIYSLSLSVGSKILPGTLADYLD